jgi:hypothetical protein
MSQPKCAQRRVLRVLLEELARASVERWKQLVQALHLARRQGPGTQSVIRIRIKRQIEEESD